MALLDDVPHPIVLAPLAGGPSTPELTAAVTEAGGLAFLAAGYLTTDALAERIDRTRTLTDRPFGVNVFVPTAAPADPAVVAAYSARLQPEADRLGVALGEPRFDDEHWDAKLDLLVSDPVAAVSFTFGCPSPEVIDRLHAAGTEVWSTVTTPDEADRAAAAGVDGLVVQGTEAGGHRGTWDDHDPLAAGLPLLDLVSRIRASTDLPVVAGGGIATGADIAAALVAGADAAALGTAFLRCPEAGTNPVHRAALTGTHPTALTRAFTGRLARGITNRLMTEQPDAPSAYPEIHHLTVPLRAAARAQGDASVVNLWAGTAYQQTTEAPAADLIARLADELAAAQARWE